MGPRGVLEQLVLGALQKPPCLVSFSGGRDSSLVLAVAVHVARREGLPLPVPYTRYFGDAPEAEEGPWQEMVVRHLGLADWQRVGAGADMELVGARAQGFLLRHGVVFPPMLYVLGESLGAARGGSHLSGEGGDQVLGPRRATYLRFALSSPRWTARPAAARAVLAQLAPRPVRYRLLRRRYEAFSPRAWLRPAALSAMASQLAWERAGEPLLARGGLRWELASRRTSLIRANVAALAATYAVAHCDPLLEPAFVAALARAGGRLGFSSRAAAMAYLAGDLLPQRTIGRSTKAVFNTAYLGPLARDFARRWSGAGADPGLVDPEALRAEWLKPVPAAQSFVMLQAAWLAENRPPAQDR